MAIPLNMFEEDWVKKMNVLLENAKKSRESYDELIDSLERRFMDDSGQVDSRVKSYVAEVRRRVWPEDQFAREASLLEVVSKETFGILKRSDNFKKFSEYHNKRAGTPAPQKSSQ